ncbi:MAG TPA: hypothetical protein DCQ06_13885 [Myxococcales bacterium]|nr:hypothetical protein [Myxococcales bacterium]HAN32679.1 hypothetical protein [Myxococcales bacterium]
MSLDRLKADVLHKLRVGLFGGISRPHLSLKGHNQIPQDSCQAPWEPAPWKHDLLLLRYMTAAPCHMTLPTLSDLDALRRVGDPLADAVVASLSNIGRPIRFEEVQRAAAQGDAACERFVQVTATPPDWVRWSRIERGRRLFVRTHVLSSAALLLGGMIESYTNPHIAEVLTYSGRLVESSRRRIMETGQMVYDTHLPDGLRPGAQGWRTLLQIRLLHGHIRFHLSKRRGSNADAPINQEDSAYTHLMFDVGVAEGLCKLGVTWSAEERQLHHEFWRLAGWFLGVDPVLLPASEREAVDLRSRIRGRHFAVDANAIELTQALLEGVELEPPFFLPKTTLFALTRRLQGRPISNALQIPQSRIHRLLVRSIRRPLSGFGWLLREVQPLEKLSHEVGQRYGQWIIARGLEGRPATFETRGNDGRP